jgi:hypothetical protein
MPSKAELMASGQPFQIASKIGYEPLTTFTAAGTSQTTATTLTANFANVTTSSIGTGVILAAPFERAFVWNSGPNTLTIYPPVGGTILGLSQNVGMTLANANGVSIEGDGVNFGATYSN